MHTHTQCSWEVKMFKAKAGRAEVLEKPLYVALTALPVSHVRVMGAPLAKSITVALSEKFLKSHLIFLAFDMTPTSC